MPGLCLYPSPTDTSEPIAAYIWRSSDYIERGIFIALALMLAYTVFVVGRFWQRYYVSRSEIRRLTPDDFPGIRRATLNFIAEMCPAIAMLRGIASAAPFLGLAGTCYGFLAGFYRIGSDSRASALAATADMIANVPTPTLAGILVAIPAAFFYNSLRTRIERISSQVPSCTTQTKGLGSLQFAQTLPLKRRFSGLPPYALVAAPFLSCVIMVYMAYKPFPGPVGLGVRLPQSTCEHGDFPDRIIVLRVTKERKLFLNMEPEEWSGLAQRLSDIYRMRKERVLYFRADDEVPFQTAAEVIDLVKSSLGAESQPLDVTVRLITPGMEPESRACYESIWHGRGFYIWK